MPELATLGLRMEGEKAIADAQQFGATMDKVGEKSEAAAAKVTAAGRAMTAAVTATLSPQQQQAAQLERWNALADANAAKQAAMRQAQQAATVVTVQQTAAVQTLAVAQTEAAVTATALNAALGPQLLIYEALSAVVTFAAGKWSEYRAQQEERIKALAKEAEAAEKAAAAYTKMQVATAVDRQFARARLDAFERGGEDELARTERQQKAIRAGMASFSASPLNKGVDPVGVLFRGEGDAGAVSRLNSEIANAARVIEIEARLETLRKESHENDKQRADESDAWREKNFRDVMADIKAVADQKDADAAREMASRKAIADLERQANRADVEEDMKAVEAREKAWTDSVRAVFTGTGDVMSSIRRSVASTFADGVADALRSSGVRDAIEGIGGWLKGAVGDAFGAIKGGLSSGLGIAGLAVGGIALIAGAFGAFEDSADQARRAAIAMAEAQNAYAKVTQDLTRTLSGSGGTPFDAFKKFRDDTNAAIAANANNPNNQIRGAFGLPTGQLTPAGMTEERRLLDQLTAAEKRVTDEYKAGLEVRRLAAQGLSDQADAQRLLIQQQKEYADLRAAQVSSDLLAQLATTQAAERAAYVTAKYAGTLSSLSGFQNSLSLSSLTTLSPGQQLAEAQRQYQDVLARAQGGDQSAAGQLSGAAQAYLNASRSYNASGSAYAADYNRVQGDTSAVIDAFKARATAEQQALDAAAQANQIAQAGFTNLGNGIAGTNNRLDKLIAVLKGAAEGGGSLN